MSGAILGLLAAVSAAAVALPGSAPAGVDGQGDPGARAASEQVAAPAAGWSGNTPSAPVRLAAVTYAEPPGGRSPGAAPPCAATARACVKLSSRQAWLMDHGRVVYGPVPIIAGKPRYPTPPGTFHVQWKDLHHRSTEFNNAPMPYSVFFYDGMAFHTGSLQEESHGCIHLANAAARKFFNYLSVGDVVQILS